MNESPSLTAEEVGALPEGTEIEVIWSGGNGPHRYLIHVEGDRRYAGQLDGNPRYLTHSRLSFVGQERYHTRVWVVGAARGAQ